MSHFFPDARASACCQRLLPVLAEFTLAEAAQALAMAGGLVRQQEDARREVTRFNPQEARAWAKFRPDAGIDS